MLYKISQNLDRGVPWGFFIPPLCWLISFILQHEWASVKTSCLPLAIAISRLLFLNSLAVRLDGKFHPPPTTTTTALPVSVCFSSYMKPCRLMYIYRYRYRQMWMRSLRDERWQMHPCQEGLTLTNKATLVDPPLPAAGAFPPAAWHLLFGSMAAVVFEFIFLVTDLNQHTSHFMKSLTFIRLPADFLLMSSRRRPCRDAVIPFQYTDYFHLKQVKVIS